MFNMINDREVNHQIHNETQFCIWLVKIKIHHNTKCCAPRESCALLTEEYKLMQPPWKTLVFFPCYLSFVPEIPPQKFYVFLEKLLQIHKRRQEINVFSSTIHNSKYAEATQKLQRGEWGRITWINCSITMPSSIQ